LTWVASLLFSADDKLYIQMLTSRIIPARFSGPLEEALTIARRMLPVLAAFGIFLFGGLSRAAFGQTGRGEITGTVTAHGHPMPGVIILVRNAVLDHQLIKADESGNYVVRLNPGTYDVMVDELGFGVQQQRIRLESGKSVRIDFQLQPPQAAGPVFRQTWPFMDVLGGGVYAFVVPTVIFTGLSCLILYSTSRRLTLMSVGTAVAASALFTALLLRLWMWFLSTHPA
jgi:hypothetical protein